MSAKKIRYFNLPSDWEINIPDESTNRAFQITHRLYEEIKEMGFYDHHGNDEEKKKQRLLKQMTVGIALVYSACKSDRDYEIMIHWVQFLFQLDDICDERENRVNETDGHGVEIYHRICHILKTGNIPPLNQNGKLDFSITDPNEIKKNYQENQFKMEQYTFFIREMIYGIAKERNYMNQFYDLIFETCRFIESIIPFNQTENMNPPEFQLISFMRTFNVASKPYMLLYWMLSDIDGEDFKQSAPPCIKETTRNNPMLARLFDITTTVHHHDNDIGSYNKEVNEPSKGRSNLVYILQHQFDRPLSFDEALKIMRDKVDKLVTEYLFYEAELLSLLEDDEHDRNQIIKLSTYLKASMVGNDVWSATCRRYHPINGEW